MAKNVKSKHPYLGLTIMAVLSIVWLSMFLLSLRVSLVRGLSTITLLVIAYFILTLYVSWIFVNIETAHKNIIAHVSKRDRYWAVIGFFIFPLMLAGSLLWISPATANILAYQKTTESFVYVTSEIYGRKGRGLLTVKLVDQGGEKHWVTFDKERLDKLSLKCGDILITKGRSSFLGYVIDSEAKDTSNTKSCPQV